MMNFAAGEGPDEMRAEGSAEVDTFLDITPTPRLSVSCMLHPAQNGVAYFICENRYVAINVKPGTTSDTIAWGPKSIVGNWPSLVRAGFGNVDAVLPVSGNLMYFFCRDQYAHIDIKPGECLMFTIYRSC